MKKTLYILLVMTIACCALCACGTDDIDISSYADRQIVLRGITEEDIIITIDDLKAMDCRTLKTECTSDKVGVVKVTGPELDTVLEPYGVSKADFSKMMISGSDEYDCRLKSDYFTEHDLYLAFGIDGEPLDEEDAPCRLIIPESDSAYWVRMINMIEFTK